MTEPWADSRTPALAIVARGDQIEECAQAEYAVSSQSRPGVKYRVTRFRDSWACDCPFFTETKRACIHVIAVRFKVGVQEKAPPEVSGPVCDRCQSGDVTLKGKRYNKSGVIHRYLCKSCGRRFTGRDGFQRRRADPEKIALALDLYFRGMSVRKIAEHFAQVHNLKVSPATVYYWLVRYSRIAAEWMDRQGAGVGQRWHVDETVVSIDGKRCYVWNVLDAETRFLLATHVSRDRSMTDTRAPLHKAKKVADESPVEVFSDGMGSYPRAIHNEFGRGGYSPHHRVPSIRAPESNNLVERLHGTEKERIKVMRGFDNPKGAAALMEGFRVHYNMVRNHQSLGTTPGEEAGLPPVTGFRWVAKKDGRSEVLRMATQELTGEPEIRVITERPIPPRQHD
jgi:transposase-like protein